MESPNDQSPKKIAPALGIRGLLFALLGLVLLARAVPTLLSMDGVHERLSLRMRCPGRGPPRLDCFA